jgi:tetratricopeptide (TPR) repeat protein
LRADVDQRNEALAEAQAALIIDPRSSLALQVVAWGQLFHVLLGTAPRTTVAWQEGISAVTRAIEVDRGDSLACAAKACLLCFAADKQRAAEDLPNARRAYELNPNSMWSVTALAVSEMCTGLPDEAIAHLYEGIRLNPRDPLRASSYSVLSMCYVLTGDYHRGAEFAQLGIADAPGLPQLHGHLAMNLVGLGDIAAAQVACAEARRLSPAWVAHCLAGRIIYRKPEHLRRATTFLRVAAGLEDPGAAAALR